MSGGEDHRWKSFSSVDRLPETAGSRRVSKGRKSGGSATCFTVAFVTVYHEIDRGFLPVPEHLPIGQLGGSGMGFSAAVGVPWAWVRSGAWFNNKC